MKVKEESEKVGLKLNMQKTKIMASGPITSWKMEKQWKILKEMGIPDHLTLLLTNTYAGQEATVLLELDMEQ